MKLFPSFGQRTPDNKSDVIDGERDTAAVNKDLSLPARLAKWIGIVGAAGFSTWFIWSSINSAAAQRDQEQAPAKEVRPASSEPRPLPPLLPDTTPVAAAPAQAQAPLAPLAKPATDPAAGANGQPRPLSPAELLLKRRLESPLSFESSAGAELAAGAAATAGAAGTAVPTVSAQARGAQASRPYLLPNPSMTLARGMMIPCEVLPALDTTLPGDVICIQSRDVWGVGNKVKLLEKGTLWTGRQGSGIAQGQRRVGIVWTQGLTPNNVVVPVESAATDMLGRPGMAGEIDNHFWDRFSAAILLSVISDIGPALAASRSGGNNNTTVAFPNITGGAQEVVAEVLKTTINIPPTLTAPQAAEILIYVNQPINFSDVYQLEATK